MQCSQTAVSIPCPPRFGLVRVFPADCFAFGCLSCVAHVLCVCVVCVCVCVTVPRDCVFVCVGRGYGRGKSNRNSVSFCGVTVSYGICFRFAGGTSSPRGLGVQIATPLRPWLYWSFGSIDHGGLDMSGRQAFGVEAYGKPCRQARRTKESAALDTISNDHGQGSAECPLVHFVLQVDGSTRRYTSL